MLTDFLMFSARAFNSEGELVGDKALNLDEWNSSHTETSVLDEQELEGVYIEAMEFNVNGYPLWTITIAFTEFQVSDIVTRVIVTATDTSGNESTAEKELQRLLLTNNKTTLVIAHRLSTIKNSKKIYVIDDGKIVADGNHENLLKNSEIYKNFYEKQIQKN